MACITWSKHLLMTCSNSVKSIQPRIGLLIQTQPALWVGSSFTLRDTHEELALTPTLVCVHNAKASEHKPNSYDQHYSYKIISRCRMFITSVVVASIANSWILS